MFYCDPCGKTSGWPEGLMRSHGRCEVCGDTAECSDVPSKHLPNPNKVLGKPRIGDILGTALVEGLDARMEYQLSVLLLRHGLVLSKSENQQALIANRGKTAARVLAEAMRAAKLLK